MAFRGAIPDFQLANPLYIGAKVTFFTVTALGIATTTQATLFAGPTGTTTALNPQTLDSEGKFTAPVYIEVPVIAVVTGATVGSHTTGVINPRGTWRGNWATATVYYSTDFVVDPVSGNIYAAALDYTSSASLATDIAAGNLILVIDQAAIISGGAAKAIKQAVRAAATAPITLSGLQTIDGVVLAAGDRVLVPFQSDARLNGIYNVASGAWTRSVDMNVSAMFGDGCIVYVLSGTLNHTKGYQFSCPQPFTLGTTPVSVTAINFPDGEILVSIGVAPDATMSTGFKGYRTVPYDCTVIGWTLISNTPGGSIVIDVTKSTYAAFPPVTSITASSKPTLTAQQSNQDAVLAGWTTLLSKGDVLGFNVQSVSGLQFGTLALKLSRN